MIHQCVNASCGRIDVACRILFVRRCINSQSICSLPVTCSIYFDLWKKRSRLLTPYINNHIKQPSQTPMLGWILFFRISWPNRVYEVGKNLLNLMTTHIQTCQNIVEILICIRNSETTESLKKWNLSNSPKISWGKGLDWILREYASKENLVSCATTWTHMSPWHGYDFTNLQCLFDKLCASIDMIDPWSKNTTLHKIVFFCKYLIFFCKSVTTTRHM